MVQNGIAKGDYSALEEYYIEKVLKIVDSLNRSDIIWQDPIDHGAKVNITFTNVRTAIKIWSKFYK